MRCTVLWLFKTRVASLLSRGDDAVDGFAQRRAPIGSTNDVEDREKAENYVTARLQIGSVAALKNPRAAAMPASLDASRVRRSFAADEATGTSSTSLIAAPSEQRWLLSGLQPRKSKGATALSGTAAIGAVGHVGARRRLRGRLANA